MVTRLNAELISREMHFYLDYRKDNFGTIAPFGLATEIMKLLIKLFMHLAEIIVHLLMKIIMPFCTKELE